MATSCFLVERCNEITVHEDCSEPDCDCGGWDDTTFDLRRVDSGEIVCTALGHMYRNPTTGAGVPVGAMWYEDYSSSSYPKGPDDWEGIKPEHRKGPHSPSFIFQDGPHLIVMTPGGPWNIDSRASNCGSPYDYQHRCWVRHGEPPNITVDKNGTTCTAGAGSIQCGSYHGFLRNGALT